MVKTELYFGLSKRDGGAVSDAEFDAFLEDTVTGDLPEGFTLVNAYGQYQLADSSILKQPTKVVVFFHEDSVEESAAIEDVVSSYRERFDGARVLRATSVADTRFYVD